MPPDPRPSPQTPAAISRLVGRQREVDELVRLLRQNRLLTLTGAGGSGKTRLALEVMGRLHAEEGGRTWIDLAPLDEPVLLPHRIIRALGGREEVPSGNPEAILPFLDSGPCLLVLDNCEHLVDACAELVEVCLRARPELKVLATSREPLGLSGEAVWLVPPLELPEPSMALAEARACEAIHLFEDRARDASSDFRIAEENVSAVAEICRRLDGLPLAIELAAARVKVLSVEQIRDRLDDLLRFPSADGRRTVPRHRTLKAAVDWSHDLLPEPARVLFRRLSVFRGGFGLDGAAAVDQLSPDSDPLETLEHVGRLVDRSLVRVREVRGAARYSLLETIRQYADLRLEESGEGEEIRARHARFMAEMAARSAPHLTGSERGPYEEALLVELDNFRAALQWSRDGAPALHARLAADLSWFRHFTAALGGDSPPPSSAQAGEGPVTANGPPASSITSPPPAQRLRVRTLGAFEVEGESVGEGSWSYARPQELLVYLLLHPKGAGRAEIGEAIWPGATPPQLKNSFHVTLHHLRRRLGDPGWIVLESDRYRLAHERGIDWDAERFEGMIREAIRGERNGAGDPTALRSALDLYGGDLLDGVGLGRWIEEARDHYRRLFVDGWMALARVLEDSGAGGEALDAWERVTTLEELNEEGHRGMMRAWSRSGARDRALRHFLHFSTLLQEAFGAEPEEETLVLYRSLLTSNDPSE